MRDYDLSLLQNMQKLEIDSFALKSSAYSTSVTLNGVQDGRYCVATLLLEKRPEYCKVTYKEYEADNRGVELGWHQFNMTDARDVLIAITYFGDAAGEWSAGVYRLKVDYFDESADKSLDDA